MCLPILKKLEDLKAIVSDSFADRMWIQIMSHELDALENIEGRNGQRSSPYPFGLLFSSGSCDGGSRGSSLLALAS